MFYHWIHGTYLDSLCLFFQLITPCYVYFPLRVPKCCDMKPLLFIHGSKTYIFVTGKTNDQFVLWARSLWCETLCERNIFFCYIFCLKSNLPSPFDCENNQDVNDLDNRNQSQKCAKTLPNLSLSLHVEILKAATPEGRLLRLSD